MNCLSGDLAVSRRGCLSLLLPEDLSPNYGPTFYSEANNYLSPSSIVNIGYLQRREQHMILYSYPFVK